MLPFDTSSIRPVHSFNYKETHHVIRLLYTILKNLIDPLESLSCDAGKNGVRRRYDGHTFGLCPARWARFGWSQFIVCAGRQKEKKGGRCHDLNRMTGVVTPFCSYGLSARGSSLRA